MKLSLVYRKYLRGSDLAKPLIVEIMLIKTVQVQPHPTAPKQDKQCLYVKGQPADLPNAILMGPRAVDQLVEAVGDLDTEQLPGRKVEIYPVPIRINGVTKSAIGIRKPAVGAPPSVGRTIQPQPQLPRPEQDLNALLK